MKITNKHGLPQEIVNAVERDEYDFTPEQGKYSVSELINPVRQVMLYRRHSDKVVRDVTDFMPRLLGVAIHKIIEHGAEQNALQEERLESPIAGGVLSGKMDIYKEGEIIDVKTTSVWTLYHSPKGRAEWQWQTNAYAWLLRQHGFPVNKITIFAILLGWNKREAAIKGKQGYPQAPMTLLDMPVMSNEEIEDWIADKMRERLQCEKLSDNDLPICDERWKNEIRCKEYCDVCEMCDYYNNVVSK